jgi:hypothetical protein
MLRVRLRISRNDNVADYSLGKRFRFAVVNLDKAKDYPMNFVCMLPIRVSSDGHKTSVFERRFGCGSLDLAKKLLGYALRTEDDPDIRVEIERRLRLLEPGSVSEKVCVSCGRTFVVDGRKRFRQRFCEDCLRRKFGARE